MSEVEQEVEQPVAEAPEEPQEGTGDVEEAEGTEDAPVTPEEPEDGAQEAAILSEQERQKRDTSLDKLRLHVEKRTTEILGDEFAYLLPCPLCDPVGYIYQSAIGTQPDEVRMAVHMALGEGGQQSYVHADDAEQCPKCNGLGSVETGSQVRGQEVLTCRHCNGRGWIGPRSASAAAPAPVENGGEPAPLALVQPSAASDPPEAVMLRDQGWIVVAPIQG